MKKAPSDTKYTIARYSQLVGIDRHTLAKNIEATASQPTAEKTAQGAATYHLRDLVAATIGGDFEAERLRKIRAESERLELQNSRSKGELIEVERVKKLGERIMIAIRQKILQSILTDDEKDKILLDLLNLKNMDWTRDP